MENKYEITEHQIDHPLDDVLGIEPGMTVIERSEREPAVLSECDIYDEKDAEIEEQFQEVYELALEAYENSAEIGQTIEPKYKARNDEVAAQYLTLALNAAKEKMSLKVNKDKSVQQSTRGGGVTNNNLIIDRNALMELLDEGEGDKTSIDGDYEEVE